MKKRQIVGAVLGVAAVLLLAIIVIREPQEPALPEVERQQSVVTYSTDNPEEDQNAPFDWTGEVSDPKYITLPSIEAEGFIQKVGVDQNSEVAVPTNIHVAGWFVQSAKPGDKGLSIIDGHVNGRSQDGIFKQLSLLGPDDTFTIERGDGSVLEYRVRQVSNVSVDEAPTVLFSQLVGVSEQLNLITCGGEFDAASRQYDQRVIVNAERVL